MAWLELPSAGSAGDARWLLSQVGADAKPRLLAEVEGSRTSGFASLVKAPGGGLLFAWTTRAGGVASQTGVATSRIQ